MAPIGVVAPILIARRCKRVRKAVDGITELTPHQRHEVRIATRSSFSESYSTPTRSRNSYDV